MTDARKILEMIENVAVDDVAALDEIDLVVWEYRHKAAYPETWFGPVGDMKPLYPPKVTRSRDALKAIRPEGYTLRLHYEHREVPEGYCAVIENDSFAFDSYMDAHPLPTEELAELHAIIQAIEYERNASKGGV